MKNRLILAIALAAGTVAATGESQAGYMQPGETMGVALIAPLPEGIFFGDLESYSRSPHIVPGKSVGLGVNIPVLIWSTPISFYNTRLEFIATTPFAHLDGAGLDRIGFVPLAVGPLLAHDFGNGLTGGLGVAAHTPDLSSNIEDLSGRTHAAIDFRQSLEYKIPSGPFEGITLIENTAWTSCLCSGSNSISSDGLPVTLQNDLFAGDFTVEKSFGKMKLGFVGYGNIDTNNQARLTNAATDFNPRERDVALGGLIGYDFGRFTLSAMVTHSLFRNSITPAISAGEVTRGWMRVLLPLYVAPPPAAPVVARY